MRQYAQYRTVKLSKSMAKDKQDFDKEYLLSLKNENLLFSFYTEAGLNGLHRDKLGDIHGGWDGPLSHIRGTFTGHWLSACARLYDETKDEELKARVDYVVGEIRRCQEVNGGWAFSIPEKYLYQLRRGVRFWACQYVCHKIMMGLLDAYVFLKNETAMDILLECGEWFLRFTDDTPREVMDEMMENEETGGMMEFWADLYSITGKEEHKLLMQRYERPRLTEPLLRGEDVLTNMHANATIPEIHGCIRAYEVTGEERYLRATMAYWQKAVMERPAYATGGQTAGEIWTPAGSTSHRLNHNTQEHCVVYNMIRLADYLYRQTGEVSYLDYIERNLINGLYSQAFWRDKDDEGIVTYYLPLEAGSHKTWGSRTNDFWCCHCTAVQAPTRYREWIWYRDDSDVFTLAQFIPNTAEFQVGEAKLQMDLLETDRGGDHLRITGLATKYPVLPKSDSYTLRIRSDMPVTAGIKIRLPSWLAGDAIFTLNGQEIPGDLSETGFVLFSRTWQTGDVLTMEFPRQLTCYPMDDDPHTVAFLDGPVVLAGLSGARLLHGDIAHPETMLTQHNEREWSCWNRHYRTIHQDFGFVFRPIYEIGREEYTVYYEVRS